MDRAKPGERNRLPSLLFIVFLSRLLFAVIIWKINGPSGFLSIDTASYVEPAKSLLNGSFSSSGLPEIFRTPGYPVLLLPAVALGHLALIALFENVLLATGCAWMIWGIVDDLFPGSKAAFWAVVFYSVEPLGFLQSEKIMTETAFTVLFLVFVRVLARFFREASLARLTFAAAALGCATYMRPVPLYLGLGLMPVVLLFCLPSSWPQRLARAAIFPLVFAMVLAPWTIRNAVVADYAGFSSTPPLDLYFYSAAAVQAKLSNRPFAQVQQEMGWADNEVYFRIHPEQRTWSQGRIARFCQTEARGIILKHLSSYLVIHAKGSAATMLNPGVTELLMDIGLYPPVRGSISSELERGLVPALLWLLRQYPVAAVALPLMAAQLIAYYVLAFVGWRRLPIDIRWLFAVLVVYFIAVSGIPGAVSRWRVPIMPLVCICAGIAVARWRGKEPAQKATAAEQ